MLTDVAKVVTDLGALPTCVAVVVVGPASCSAARGAPGGARRCWSCGFALIYVARARSPRPASTGRGPPAPLVDTSGSSFPSGHAAYATAWVAAALMFTRRLAAGRRGARDRRRCVLAAAIGLSRIYLRAHYWSDVAGGWGLGVGIFGLLARDRDDRRATCATMAERARAGDRRARGAMNFDFSSTEIAIALAAGVVVSCCALR